MIFQSTCCGCGGHTYSICIACRQALVESITDHVPGAPESVVYALAYSGLARKLILGLKYRNERATSRLLAEVLVHRLDADLLRADVVTWAPTSAQRRRRRGHDQAELIARAFARQIHKPCRSLLVNESIATQTGAGRAQRLSAPQFRGRRCRRDHHVRYHHVLVVDDVVTTGATLRAAAHALCVAGAKRVNTLAVAATPALESRR